MHKLFSPCFLGQLERQEGFYARPYLCPAGRCTIGFGTNLEAHPGYIASAALRTSVLNGALQGRELVNRLALFGMVWSREQARAAMLEELETCHAALLRQCPPYAALRAADGESGGVRADVLLNMAFNIGVNGLLQFRKMLNAVTRGDYPTAAVEMRDSAWYRQVKTRAVELCEQMRTGAYKG